MGACRHHQVVLVIWRSLHSVQVSRCCCGRPSPPPPTCDVMRVSHDASARLLLLLLPVPPLLPPLLPLPLPLPLLLLLLKSQTSMRPDAGPIICLCRSGRTDRSSNTKTRLATITGTVPQRGFRLPVRCCMLRCGGEGVGCSLPAVSLCALTSHCCQIVGKH